MTKILSGYTEPMNLRDGVQYMVERKWKIRKNGILVEKAARVYYTHQGVSQ